MQTLTVLIAVFKKFFNFLRKIRYIFNFNKNVFFVSSRRNNRTDDAFSNKRCINWFKEYTTSDDPEVLGMLHILWFRLHFAFAMLDVCQWFFIELCAFPGPEGMERFCKDLEVAPENIVMLGELISELFSFDGLHLHFIILKQKPFMFQCWHIKWAPVKWAFSHKTNGPRA